MSPSPFPVLDAAPHRIRSVTLTVRDLGRAVEFYRSVIGLAVRDRQDGLARLGTDDATLLTLRGDPAVRPHELREAGLFHTAFLLPRRADLGAWIAFAKDLGIALDGAADHAVSEAVYLADPEGNGIEIYVDRPPEVWPRAGDTIAMTNAPLDFAGLAALGASEPWRGFPALGTLGHVHLQVGDTAAAERFYGELLGFDVTCRYRGASFFGSGGYHHQFGANVWNSRGAGPRPADTAGVDEVELAIDGSTLSRILDAADEADVPVEDGSVVRDPWGTAIRLAAD